MCERLDYDMRHRWGPRLHRWWLRWRNTSLVDDLEQRTTELLKSTDTASGT